MKAEHPPFDPSSLRACGPGETFLKVQPYLSRLGITRVASQTGLDNVGIPVWCAYTPNAKAIVIAQGKGLDDEAARTSAVMEAVERAVATEPSCDILEQSLDELRRSGHSVHALDCLISVACKPIRPNEVVTWARGQRLADGSAVWVPFDAICFDRTRQHPRFWLTSDGLASGNTRDEAVLHGLLERIERDALALWAVTGSHRRFSARIDPSSFDDDRVIEMLARVEGAGLEIALFDVTTNLEVACVSALLRPRQGKDQLPIRHVDVTLGAGAAFCPQHAAARAIAEAVQSRMTFIAGARDDLVPEIYSRPADPAILQAFEVAAMRNVDDMPRLHAMNAGEALVTLRNHLAERGIDDLFHVDLAPDWLPVSVVRVLAPQLENPDGSRRLRFGNRALSRSLQ